MRREFNIQNKKDYLLNIENTLEDKSRFGRPVVARGARCENDSIIVSNGQTFYVPYYDDICKWNTEGYVIEMDCYANSSLSGNNGHGTFVCQGNHPGNIDYWSFGLINQKLSFYYYNGNQMLVLGTTVVPLGEWHNIKMMFKDNKITTFIDDLQEKQANISLIPQYSSGYNLVFMGYTGSIDAVRLKNIRIYIEEN